MDEVAFEVVDRLYVTGRGHVTVINNKDLIPIEIDDMVVEDDEFSELPTTAPCNGCNIEVAGFGSPSGL